jgi:flagellar motility protein MotE (MotC chaperone)
MAKPKPKIQRTPFIRLLPILIAVAALMLSFRINDIRKGFFDGASLRVAGELQAQQPEGKSALGQSNPPGQQVAQAAPPESKSAPPAAPPSPAAASAGGDHASLSQTEMDVLQKLQERRGTLDGRERDVERREALLKAAEDQIERKISEMKSLQHQIEGLLRQYNDQEDSKMRSLVKIYENMKPKDAAKIFEQLDMGIMLEVVERMKEQKVAPILAEMNPVKARELTSELAQRRQMPQLRPVSGG